MKYLKMFFASLQMARTLDSRQFKQDCEGVPAMIDDLCPEESRGRPAATQNFAGSASHTAARPA